MSVFRRRGRKGAVRRQVEVAQQLVHEALHLDQVAQGVGLGGADGAGVAHLGQQLGDDIVVGLDLVGQQRCAQELLERVDRAVQELEHQQRLDLGRGRQEEEQVRMAKTENERRRVGVG